MKKSLYLIIIWGFLILFSPNNVFAADDISLGLQTPVVYKTLSQGETEIIQIELSNLGETEIVIESELKNIDDVDDLGQIEISDNKPIWNEWITFDSEVFTLNPGETQNYSFALEVPSGVEAGAYYGILSFSSYPKSNLNTSSVVVDHSVAVGSVLLMNILGEGSFYHEGRVLNWNRDSELFLNHKFTLDYQNTGDTVFIPVGTVNVYDWRGKLIDMNVLEDHWLLPGKNRLYELNWSPQNSFGFYRAEISIQNTINVDSSPTLLFFSFTGIGIVYLVIFFVIILFLSLIILKKCGKIENLIIKAFSA